VNIEKNYGVKKRQKKMPRKKAKHGRWSEVIFPRRRKRKKTLEREDS